MDRTQARDIAQQILGMVQSKGLTMIGTSEISEAIDRAKSKIEVPASNQSASHPSQERFLQLLADEIFKDLSKEKPCPYEPGRACDYCSMCNSLGF
jgi:hypothetical protein